VSQGEEDKERKPRIRKIYLCDEFPDLLPDLDGLEISSRSRYNPKQHKLPEGLKRIEVWKHYDDMEPDSDTIPVTISLEAGDSLDFADEDLDVYSEEDFHIMFENFKSKYRNMEMSFLELPLDNFSTDALEPIGKYPCLKEITLRDADLPELDLSFLSSLEELEFFGFFHSGVEKLVKAVINTFQEALWEHFGIEISAEYRLVPFPLKQLDLTPLNSCKKLKKLWISGTEISTLSLSPLSSCRNLEHLGLSGNSLVSLDLTPISECPITTIDLSHNSLKTIDLMPLEKCRGIEEINLTSNPLDTHQLIIPKGWESYQEGYWRPKPPRVKLPKDAE